MGVRDDWFNDVLLNLSCLFVLILDPRSKFQRNIEARIIHISIFQ